MSFEFKKPEVAAKYEPGQSTDQLVHLPRIKPANDPTGTPGWKGMMSEIPLEIADRLFERKSNLIKIKKTNAPAVLPRPNADKKRE